MDEAKPLDQDELNTRALGKRGGGAPGIVGAPKFVPTPEMRERVRSLAGLGVTQENASWLMGMSRSTLIIHFSEDWAIGKATAFAAVAQTAYQRAVGVKKPDGSYLIEPDPIMTKYWLSMNGFGKQEVEQAEVDLSCLTDEELEWYDRIAHKLNPPDEDEPEEFEA